MHYNLQTFTVINKTVPFLADSAHKQLQLDNSALDS